MIAPPPGPCLEWSLDLVVDLPTSGTYHHVLTCVDTFSKYVVFVPLEDRRASSVAYAFKSHVLAVFGVPLYLRCDNGGEFKREFAGLATTYGISLRTTAPYHSNANG